MDSTGARAFEAVAVAVRRLRSHIRLGPVSFENGVRVATSTAPKWMLEDALDASDHADIVRADAILDEIKTQPNTVNGWRRMTNGRARKMRNRVGVPRERFDPEPPIPRERLD